MNLVFVDQNPAVIEALRIAFISHHEVQIESGDLLSRAFGAVLSPANSSGFMDGGIDARYRSEFGKAFEIDVLNRAPQLPNGIPVGTAIVLPVNHPRISSVIIAPTMEFPDTVQPINARRALAAALRVAAEREIQDLFSPGLCTGVGMVDPPEAAAQMAAAYETWLQKRNQSG